MPVLTRSDERERLADAVLVAASVFLRSKDDNLSVADAYRLLTRRITRLSTQRAMRSTDPNLHSRISISMTGSV
jgi:hypothetical protein